MCDTANHDILNKLTHCRIIEAKFIIGFTHICDSYSPIQILKSTHDHTSSLTEFHKDQS